MVNGGVWWWFLCVATVLGDYVEVAHSGVGWLDEEALLSVWVYRDA